MSRTHIASFALAAVVAAGLVAPISAQEAPVASRPRTAPATPPAPIAPAPQGQATGTVPAPVVVYQSNDTVNDVRQQLNDVLNRYPPTLRTLFRLDPSLLNRPDYMAAYPQLSAFV